MASCRAALNVESDVAKTHSPIYLWCLFLGAGGQTGTGRAFANSRQTRTGHVRPWLCPRKKKHVWPACSTAEAGKSTGCSQEERSWLLDVESQKGKVRRAESAEECQVHAFQSEGAAADVWVLRRWTGDGETKIQARGESPVSAAKACQTAEL